MIIQDYAVNASVILELSTTIFTPTRHRTEVNYSTELRVECSSVLEFDIAINYYIML